MFFGGWSSALSLWTDSSNPNVLSHNRPTSDISTCLPIHPSISVLCVYAPLTQRGALTAIHTRSQRDPKKDTFKPPPHTLSAVRRSEGEAKGLCVVVATSMSTTYSLFLCQALSLIHTHLFSHLSMYLTVSFVCLSWLYKTMRHTTLYTHTHESKIEREELGAIYLLSTTLHPSKEPPGINYIHTQPHTHTRTHSHTNTHTTQTHRHQVLLVSTLVSASSAS